jgi:hypothetical protein
VLGRGGAVQGGFQRLPLRIRELGAALLEHRDQDVREGGEGEAGLALGRSHRRDANRVVQLGQGSGPQRGLADSGLAFDEEDARAGP